MLFLASIDLRLRVEPWKSMNIRSSDPGACQVWIWRDQGASLSWSLEFFEGSWQSLESCLASWVTGDAGGLRKSWHEGHANSGGQGSRRFWKTRLPWRWPFRRTGDLATWQEPTAAAIAYNLHKGRLKQRAIHVRCFLKLSFKAFFRIWVKCAFSGPVQVVFLELAWDPINTAIRNVDHWWLLFANISSVKRCNGSPQWPLLRHTYLNFVRLSMIVPRWRCETCQPLKPLTANLWKHMKTVFAPTKSFCDLISFWACKVLVYDIGGGTLDTSLLYMNGNAVTQHELVNPVRIHWGKVCPWNRSQVTSWIIQGLFKL